jgi:hypothetical protein
MINEVFLAFYNSIGGGAIGDLLFRWEQAGVFSYVLPFLLIFALVYGLLSKMSLFGHRDDPQGNRGINVVIAVAVSLLSLQFDLVSVFFAEIFPKVGVGLAIILALFIIVGIFWPSHGGFNWVMIIFGLVVVAYIIFSSLGVLGSIFGSSFSALGLYGWDWGTIIAVVVFVGAFIAIIVPRRDPNRARNAPDNLLTRSLFGAPTR